MFVKQLLKIGNFKNVTLMLYNLEGSNREESRREGTCVCLWMIHVDVRQKSSLYCKVIIL